MQVVDANNGLLTNVEVLELLKERKALRQQQSQTSTSIVSDRLKIESQHRISIENKVSVHEVNQYDLR
jgi:hypothetical protein